MKEGIKEQILEWNSYLPAVKAQSIDVLVSNIVDIIKGKKCNMSCGYDSTYGFVPEADCPVHDTPTEPFKCDECQFEEGHSQSCSKYVKGKPFEEDILLQIEKEISEQFKYVNNGVMNMDYNDKEAVGFNRGLQVALEIIKKYK